MGLCMEKSAANNNTLKSAKGTYSSPELGTQIEKMQVEKTSRKNERYVFVIMMMMIDWDGLTSSLSSSSLSERVHRIDF